MPAKPASATIQRADDIGAYREAQHIFDTTVRALSSHTATCFAGKFDHRDIAERVTLVQRLSQITRQMAAADAGRISWEQARNRIYAALPDKLLPGWVKRSPEIMAEIAKHTSKEAA